MPETPASPATPRHVFVYGTLRKGDDNDITRMSPVPVYVGSAQIAGTMYHLGAYPGVVLGGRSLVFGEVYAISAALETQLDALEAEYPSQPDEYLKREVSIAVGGADLLCVVYEINPIYLDGRPVINSGDWVASR